MSSKKDSSEEARKAYFAHATLKAAQLGHPRAQLQVGMAYLNPDIWAKTFNVPVKKASVYTGVSWLEKSFKNGEPDAAQVLGDYYRDVGLLKKAVHWYLKGIEAGYSSCYHSLGALYLNNPKLKAKPDQIFSLLDTAVKKGVVRANVELGWLHYSGIGTKRNVREAINRWKAAGDNKNAYYLLARAYLQNDLVRSLSSASHYLALFKAKPSFKWGTFTLGIDPSISDATVQRIKLDTILRDQAIQKDETALYVKGLAHYFSLCDCLKRNDEAALEYFQNSLKTGHKEAILLDDPQWRAMAEYYIARCLDRLDDHEKAAHSYRIAAEAGIKEAEFYLALPTLYAENASLDERQKALETIRGFAERKFSPACVVYAVWMLKQSSDEKTKQKAEELFDVAAKQGDCAGQYYLAESLKNRAQMSAERYVAYSWYEKSATQGFLPAIAAVALYVAENNGWPSTNWDEPLREAIRRGSSAAVKAAWKVWHANNEWVARTEEAAKRGHLDAECLFLLGKHMRFNRNDAARGDVTNGAAWLLQAAQKGHAEAQYLLGTLYRDHKAPDDLSWAPADPTWTMEERALYWFIQSAARDNPDAQYELGTCFLHGAGLPVSPEKATEWFRKAAEQGHEDARKRLLAIEG